MRIVPVLLSFLAIATAMPAQAQAPQASLELAGVVTATATPEGAVTVLVPWAYTPPHAVATSASTVGVTWTVTCDLGSGSGSSTQQGAPGAMRVEGSTTVSLQLDGAVAEADYQCGLSGNATNAIPGGEASSIEGTITLALPVVFNITMTTETIQKTSGPQKELPYFVVVTNHGNSRVVVQFALTGEPADGKWESIPPERVQLDPSQTVTIPFIVSTTYRNGYVSERAGYVLSATPVSPVDDTRRGDPVELDLQANAEGFYIPGPSPVLLLGLVGLAVVVRRRA